MGKPCKLWDGKLTAGGYGEVYFEGRTLNAHRLVYVQAHGLKLSDIDGVLIRHTCDNPPCIEPTHLLPGTPAQNSADMVARNRQAKGTDFPQAKLTEEKVRKIKHLLSLGASQNSLGKMFGVSGVTIYSIKIGKLWKHVK